MTRLAGAVAVVWMLFVAAVYFPDVGRGFVKDDFVWVQAGRTALSSFASIARPTEPGFYRPVVGASFAADYALHGLEPRGYGITNLVLYVVCAIAVALLIREVGLSLAGAALGAFAWSINPHGINMAVLWISGRTSLLLTLWSTLAAIAFLRRHRTAGALLVLLAAMSKEEAVMLPVMIGVLLVACQPGDRRSIAADVGAMAAAIALYVTLRMQTPAFLPATAPWYYRPVTDPRLLLANALQYLDRGLTIVAALTVALAGACWARPRFERRERILAAAAAVWFVAGYALTVFVPVRSSLYAVFPSVGAAVAFGVVVDALRRAAPSFDRRAPVVAAIVLLFVPIYRARNARWVEPALLSRRATAAVRDDAASLPSHGTIVFEEGTASSTDFQDAFGALAGVAVRLYTSHPLDAAIAAPDDITRIPRPPRSGDVVARYRLVDGRIDRVQ